LSTNDEDQVRDRHGGTECRWHTDPEAANRMESLQVILNCASAQGCKECVRCSERALPLFLKAAHQHRGGAIS
jgi:hypothetical protein